MRGRVGLRTVELDTSPDSIGSKFVVTVNGKPIFCKGFNWIPDDCFLDRANDPKRLRERIQQAVDAGANMLRVWGGGIYETDDFYNICDELGVMVWQDFPFACAMYPEEEPFKGEVEAEARENVARLSSHPSLVLWNGCNENIWAYRDWGWKDHADVKGKTWGLGYYLDLLPRVMRETDPSRPYWAASPWSGDPDPDNGIHPNADTHGNMHVWRPWFHEDYSSYRKFNARFCSEFGFQGPANYSTIVRALNVAATPASTPEEATQASQLQNRVSAALDFGSIEMRHRQKSGNVHDDGDLRNLRHLKEHFNLPGLEDLIASLKVPDPKPPLPDPGVVVPLHASRAASQCNFDDLHYLLQLNQCRALTLGVEWFRSRAPRCMGTLYWQLNDCWPGVTSWSAIDGDGKPKPLWYATRRFFADYIPTIQPEPDGSLSLYLVNDSDNKLVVSNIPIGRYDFEMNARAEQMLTLEVPPRTVHRVPVGASIATPRDPTREFIRFGDEYGCLWFFKPDKELKYSLAEYDADLMTIGEDDYRLRILAKSLMRDVCVLVDRLDPDATINEQRVTLLPGDDLTFEIRSTKPLEKQQLITAPVFQCANRFGAMM
jgi:beta-mannosidase